MPVKRVTYTDDTPCPFGRHKGTPMGKVPSGWLLWLFRQDWIQTYDRGDLNRYLVENQTALLKEEEDQESENEAAHSDGFNSFDDYLRYGR